MATQPHPYHRADPLPGRQWGDVIKGLGNASKHFKLTAQNVEEKLEQYKHGSFRCMGTKIKVETPTRDICGWSFIDIGGLDSSQSRSLRSELQSRKLIHKRRVCWSTHPILDRVVRAAAYDHDQKPPRQELVALLRSFADPKLNAESATAVADFLIDKALLTAFIKVESDRFVPVCSLVRRALAGTQKWLEEVHKVTPIPEGPPPINEN